MIMIINLAGVPPLPGFIAKWISIKEILQHHMLSITIMILTTSTINFYIYLRMFIVPLIKTFNNSQNFFLKTNLIINTIIIIIMLIQVILITV